MWQRRAHESAISLTALLAVLITSLAGCASLSPEEAQAKRDEIDAMSDAALARLFDTQPELRAAFDESPGYAVADIKLTKVPFVGGSEGPGIIVDKRTGKRTYLEVTRFDVGGGMGLSSFKIIVQFKDPELLTRAMSGFWRLEAGAEAGAGSASVEGSVGSASKGYQVFRLTDSGAIASVTARVVRAKPILETP